MTEADLSNKKLGAPGATIVGAWLSRNIGALATLNLRDNRIPDDQKANFKRICKSKTIDLQF